MNRECLVCLATPVAAQWIASKMPSHQVQCSQTRLPALASSSPISSGSVSLSVLVVEFAVTVEFGVQVGMPIQLSSKQFVQPTPRIGPLSTSQWLLICCCCIPCRSRKAPGSSALRCQCSRCPLEQQPDRPVHGRLANVSCCLDPCLPVCSLPSVRPPCWACLSDGHDHAALLDGPLDGLLHATLSSEPRRLP
ncbi:hypothetical protein BC831DRAFT_76064 [Entophlyctis helioformis]|nr:hypothetical protein BC831DRAFT_76064 [Entophlyctis helioformis]